MKRMFITIDAYGVEELWVLDKKPKYDKNTNTWLFPYEAKEDDEHYTKFPGTFEKLIGVKPKEGIRYHSELKLTVVEGS